MPNLQLTCWHWVSSWQTRHWPLKPTDRVGSNLVGQRSGWSKLMKTLAEVVLVEDLYFFCRIWVKNIKSSLDLSKNVLILAETTKYSPIQAKSTRLYPNLTKNQETFTRFEQKQSHFRQQPLSSVPTVLVWVAPSQTGSLGPS